MKRFVLATAVAVLVLGFSSIAEQARADRGDCGQPATAGADPIATDALAVLRAAVKLEACGLCVCDVDGNERVVTTDALAVLQNAVGRPVDLTCDVCSGAGVHGVVTAPGGSLDPAAPRGNGGGGSPLAFVEGAVVELLQIDAVGNEVRFLDIMTTDASGGYFFAASTGLGMDLMVRAYDSEEDPAISALAVVAETDLDAAAQFVFGLVLAEEGARGLPGINNFTPNEYLGCVGQARLVTPENLPADVRDLVELINQATAGLLAEQVQAFAANGDLSDAVFGQYRVLGQGVFLDASTEPGVIDVSPDLNHRQAVAYGTTDEVSLNGAGVITFDKFVATDVGLSETSGTQRLSGAPDVKVNAFTTISIEEEDEDAGEVGGYAIAGDGTFLIQTEDSIAISGILRTDGALFAGLDQEVEEGALDRGMFIGLPFASGADESLLFGNYHTIGSEVFMNLDFGGGFVARTFAYATDVGSMVANGAGTLTSTPGAGVDISLVENGKNSGGEPFDPFVSLHAVPFGAEDPEALSYEISDTGLLTVSEGIDQLGLGAVSPDGDLAVVHFFDVETGDDRAPQIFGAEHAYLALVRKAVGMTEGDLTATYRFVGMEVALSAQLTEGEIDGAPTVNFRSITASALTGRFTLEAGGGLDFPGIVLDTANLNETSFVDRTTENPAGRVTDANVTLEAETEADLDLPGSWSVDPDGALLVTVDGTVFTGAAAPDGSYFVLQGGDADDDEVFRFMLFGIRQ